LIARWMGSSEFGSIVGVTWLLLAGDTVHLGMPFDRPALHPGVQPQQNFDALRGFLAGSRWITFILGTAFALPARPAFTCSRLAQPRTVCLLPACESLRSTRCRSLRRAGAIYN